MKVKKFRGIRPDDLHGRMGLRNPERGLRTELYFSGIPGEVAGTCSCHAKQLKLDGRPLKPFFQNENIPDVPHLIRGNRLDAVEFCHAQWQDELDYLHYDGVTVMQSYCFLMQYCDSAELPAEKLADIVIFFEKVRESGAKALLRFAYELSPTLTGPTAETTLKHLEQLRPLLQKYSDVIYVLQCGFVGMFGEFHHSFNGLHDDVGFRKELLDTVLDILPPERKTMLRYPHLKMELFGDTPLSEAEAFTQLPQARIGHFNDGFMAGDTHGWTFQHPEDPARQKRTREYIRQESPFVPMDGELFWSDLKGAALPPEATKLFYDWHYDTFGMVHSNSQFEQSPYTIDIWKSVPVDPMFLRENNLPMSDGYFESSSGKHIWRSYFEYIRDHLGYRFELQSAKLPETVACGGRLVAEIRLINRGFSAAVNPRPVQLILQPKYGTPVVLNLPTDIRRWAGHNAEQLLQLDTILPPELTPGSYDVGLALPDGSATLAQRADYAIRCANALDFHDGVNWLGIQMEISR